MDVIDKAINDLRGGQTIFRGKTVSLIVRRAQDLRDQLAEAQAHQYRVCIPNEMVDIDGEIWIPAKKHEAVVDKHCQRIAALEADVTKWRNLWAEYSNWEQPGT